MPYKPLRCPTCGSTKVIAAENKRFFCVSCEGWFVWKDEPDAKQSEPTPAPGSSSAAAAPPHAHVVVPTAPAPRSQAASPQVSRSPQQPEVVTDWQTPAGYVAISIGVLAFISTWLASGRNATPFDGFLNPLFYIGVCLGWYWLNEGKQIRGEAPRPSASATQEEALRKQRERSERYKELAELRQREQEEALRRKRERERQEAERRQRERQEEIGRQKEREPQETETRQREQPQNASPDIPYRDSGSVGFLLLFAVLGGFVVLIIALASSSGHRNRNSAETIELAEDSGVNEPAHDDEPDPPVPDQTAEAKAEDDKPSVTFQQIPPSLMDNPAIQQLGQPAPIPESPPRETVLIGKVLNWKNTHGSTLVEIDLGSDDGVLMKQRLNIYRANGSFLGRIEIIHIVNNRSVGILYSGYGVSLGDYVTNRVSGRFLWRELGNVCKVGNPVVRDVRGRVDFTSSGGIAMQEPRVAKEVYIESMRSELEGLLGEVMEAVNAAPGGRVIADSEEEVRQLMHEFRRRAYERAVQMRADSAESAFPPSGERSDGNIHAQQRSPEAHRDDGQWTG